MPFKQLSIKNYQFLKERASSLTIKKVIEHWKLIIDHSLGFTLIEVLVAIAIMAFAAAVAIPNLRNFSGDQDLENDRSNLKNMLRTAQSSAASSVRCASGQTSTSWRVRLTSTTYELYSTCTTSGNETLSTKTFSVTGSIQSTSCTTLPAEFIFIDKAVSFTCSSGAPGTTFNVTFKNLKQLNITSGGVISD